MRVCDLAAPVRDPCPWGLPYHCSRKHPHDTCISGSDVNSFCCYGLVYLLEADRSSFTTYPPQGSSWGEVTNVRPGGEMYCEAHTRALAHLEDVDVTDPASTVAVLQGSVLPHPLPTHCGVYTFACAACTFHPRSLPTHAHSIRRLPSAVGAIRCILH